MKKIVFALIVLFSLFFLLGCTQPVISDSNKDNLNDSNGSFVPKDCFDSEDKQDIFVKGYIFDKYTIGLVDDKLYDTCVIPKDVNIEDWRASLDGNRSKHMPVILANDCNGPNCMVAQSFCIEDESRTESDYNFLHYTDFWACPNGCKDGACVRPECVDSDKGKDPYVKGVAEIKTVDYVSKSSADQCWVWGEDSYNGNLMRVDSASCSGENCFLNEVYCGPNPLNSYSVTYACSDGCLAGACVADGNEPVLMN